MSDSHGHDEKKEHGHGLDEHHGDECCGHDHGHEEKEEKSAYDKKDHGHDDKKEHGHGHDEEPKEHGHGHDEKPGDHSHCCEHDRMPQRGSASSTRRAAHLCYSSVGATCRHR